MEVNESKFSVDLEEEEVKMLWEAMLKKKFDSDDDVEIEPYLTNAQSFLDNNRLTLFLLSDLNNQTATDKSGIEIRGKEINKRFLREKFNDLKKSNFNKAYLQRLIYYVDPSSAIQISPFFQKRESEKNQSLGNFSPALKYLEGTWVSFNKNLEKGNVAWCFYKFQAVDSEMKVYREGYSLERLYNFQDENSYLFELQGQRYKRMKFVIANSQRLKPVILRCLSSDFGRNNDGQIIIKELLIKVPDEKANVELTEGKILVDHAVRKELNVFFDKPNSEIILNELEDYLGLNENPHYSFNDLLNIKRSHLEQIREEVEKAPFVQKLGIYIHFTSLQWTKRYTRDIVKYSRKRMGLPEKGKILKYEVFDEYTYFKKVKFNKTFPQNYVAEFTAEEDGAAVDMQCLFPFVLTDADMDAGQPLERHSHRILDATDDTFVTSAQFLNEFSKSKALFIHFEYYTEKTEMVIDFGSVKDFKKLNLRVQSIHYCHHDPEETGPRIIEYIPKNSLARGFSLLKADKKSGELMVNEDFLLDRENPKLFNLSIDFATEKGESLYIYFAFDKITE